MTERKKKRKHMDEQDRALIAAYEKEEWESLPNVRSELRIARAAARNTQKKDARINIRLSRQDLVKIKGEAIAQGIPYQTLIASLLHQYVQGRVQLR